MTITVTGISGSLRRDSLNTKLLAAARERMPDGSELSIGAIADIPLYNLDVEQEGIPPAVMKLKEQIIGTDALLLVTPEYNNSIPGVLKNAIDWCTRPPKDTAKVFAQVPVAVMGATPGGFGTVLSQTAWLPVIRTLGMHHYSERKLLASKAPSLFDDDGQLIDEQMHENLSKFLAGFVDFIRVLKSNAS